MEVQIPSVCYMNAVVYHLPKSDAKKLQMRDESIQNHLFTPAKPPHT